MRRLFVLLPLFACLASNAQETAETEKPYTIGDAGISFSKVIPVEGKTASELFSLSDNFFTYNYNDANFVIQTQDKDAGTIIGKGIFELPTYSEGFGWIYTNAIHILRIDCREGRIRVILTVQGYHHSGAKEGDISILETYPLTGEVPKPKNKQKREQKHFEIVSENSLKTIQKIEDYFLKSGNTGLENDNW